MTYNEKSLKIINHYGAMKQLKYFQTEIFELNEAIIRTEEELRIDGFLSITEENKKHIAEEIADIQVMLNQFKEYYELDELQIKIIMESKIDRQLKRIKEVEQWLITKEDYKQSDYKMN